MSGRDRARAGQRSSCSGCCRCFSRSRWPAAQLLAVGYSSVLAGNAAEAGALALAGGGDPRAGARAALPGWSRAHARVSVSGGEVRVSCARRRCCARSRTAGGLGERGGGGAVTLGSSVAPRAAPPRRSLASAAAAVESFLLEPAEPRLAGGPVRAAGAAAGDLRVRARAGLRRDGRRAGARGGARRSRSGRRGGGLLRGARRRASRSPRTPPSVSRARSRTCRARPRGRSDGSAWWAARSRSRCPTRARHSRRS